jgi:hypothetical protein
MNAKIRNSSVISVGHPPESGERRIRAMVIKSAIRE